MLASSLLRNPRLVQLGIRIDTAPAWWWLAAQLAAIGAAWLSAASSLPGAAAMAIATCALWPLRDQLRAAPRLGWLALALASTVGYTVTDWLPAGLFALGAALLAFLPRSARASVPWLPWRQLFGNTFVNRVVHKAAFAAAMLVCLAWTAAQGIAKAVGLLAGAF